MRVFWSWIAFYAINFKFAIVIILLHKYIHLHNYSYIHFLSRLLRIFHLVISNPKFDLLKKRMKLLGILKEHSETSISSKRENINAKAKLNPKYTASKSSTWIGKFSHLPSFIRLLHVVKNLYFVFQVRIHVLFLFCCFIYCNIFHFISCTDFYPPHSTANSYFVLFSIVCDFFNLVQVFFYYVRLASFFAAQVGSCRRSALSHSTNE